MKSWVIRISEFWEFMCVPNLYFVMSCMLNSDLHGLNLCDLLRCYLFVLWVGRVCFFLWWIQEESFLTYKSHLDFVNHCNKLLNNDCYHKINNKNRMLNEMETDLEQATENLSMVTIKTKELIQKSGGKRNFIIILVLSLIVVVLLFLILYTWAKSKRRSV